LEAIQDKWRAAVQLETETAYLQLVNFFISFSKKETYLPCVNQPLRNILPTKLMSLFEILGIENLIFFIDL
jgi:hypothetical protein